MDLWAYQCCTAVLGSKILILWNWKIILNQFVYNKNILMTFYLTQYEDKLISLLFKGNVCYFLFFKKMKAL